MLTLHNGNTKHRFINKGSMGSPSPPGLHAKGCQNKHSSQTPPGACGDVPLAVVTETDPTRDLFGASVSDHAYTPYIIDKLAGREATDSRPVNQSNDSPTDPVRDSADPLRGGEGEKKRNRQKMKEDMQSPCTV